MTTAANRRSGTVAIPITELEQSAFCQTSGNLRTRTLEEEFKSGVRWQKVPVRYLKLSPEELDSGIKEARETLADQLVILGHHYQRDDVIKYSDFRGDSYKLSKMAAAERDASFVVFCGVHFMAETADLLTSPNQNVILPNMAAGCSMADMARSDDVRGCVGRHRLGPWRRRRDSTHHLHEFDCGDQGPSAAETAVRCAPPRTPRKFSNGRFGSPAEYFSYRTSISAATTGLKLGVETGEMVVWNPFRPMGGTNARADQARQDRPLAGSLLRAYPIHCRSDFDRRGKLDRM